MVEPGGGAIVEQVMRMDHLWHPVTSGTCKHRKDWGYRLVAEDLPRMCKGLDLPKTEGKVTEGILHPIHYDWAQQQGTVHETRISF